MEIQEVKIEKMPIPEKRLAVKVKGETKEIFMSAGLRSQLAAYIGSIDDIVNFYSDPVLQEAAIVTVLRDRTVNGTPTTENQRMEDFDIEIEDADRLIDWIGKHVTAFFINNAMSFKDSIEKPVLALQSLILSLTGTKNSTETKPSAGPTDVS